MGSLDGWREDIWLFRRYIYISVCLYKFSWRWNVNVRPSDLMRTLLFCGFHWKRGRVQNVDVHVGYLVSGKTHLGH